MPLNVVIPQAQSAIDQTLVPAAAYTASDTAGPWIVDYYDSAEVTVAVTTCSGTLNVYVQKRLPDGTTYADLAAFSQYATAVYTTTGAKTLSFKNNGNLLRTETASTLTADTVVTAHFGSRWRLSWVLAGTGVTATFGVYGSFKKA